MTTGAFQTAASRAVDFKPMMYMQEWLDEKAALGQHPSTVRGSKNSLHYFGEFLRQDNVTSPEEITRVNIIRFQAWCNDKIVADDWTKSYVGYILKKIKAWLNWMFSLGYITEQPWNGIRLPKIDKEPKPLSDEEFSLIGAAHRSEAFSIDPFVYHRREMMLCLLYAWGLRIHELESLTVDKFDNRLDFIIVKNKGGRTKRLPYTPQIKSVVERWLRQRAAHATVGVDSLLITHTGSTLTKEYMYTLIVALGDRAGVKVNPHRLRDTFGTHMLDDKVPAEQVQVVFGHTTLRQTLAYARVNDRNVYESLARNMDPRLQLLFHNTRDLR